MSVRFVVGRAASGKTRRCLQAIHAQLLRDPLDGPRLILLVPEQASFQMERALIESPELAGFTRCEVLSFQRLAYRIFAETGADPRRGDQTIGSLGRIMVLRRLIRRERDRLVLLGRVADKPGLVKQVSTALDELIRQEIPPERLAELALQDRPDRPLETAKLSDLSRLYRSYLDYLLTDRLDPAQYLSLAAERLATCTCFDQCRVWVDGFAGFTAQEYHLLAELARRAAQVEITLLVDPHASALESDRLPGFSHSLFARTERTLVRLRRDMQSRGILMESPIRLDGSHFAAPQLAQLERHFFSDIGPGVRRLPPQPGIAALPADAQQPGPPAVCVMQFPDRRTEVLAAIAEIQRLTREERLRYRDIAVIVRDLEPYHDLLRAAMISHGIPCFIDRRQPTAHHPLVELIRAMLAVACDDCRLDSVRLTLKTGLLPLSGDDADLLENYLLASGIEGVSAWQHEWKYTRMFKRDAAGRLAAEDGAALAQVNRLRQAWWRALDPWMQAARQVQAHGRQWAASLYACLTGIDVPGKLTRWAQEAQDDGRTDEADAHRQVWSDFVELIDEFNAALGDDALTLAEFRESLEAGLAEFTLGLAPPTLDQVLVGAIERSRHPNVRAALVLGFEESSFPRRRSEDPLLGDSAREVLEEAGLDIGPSRRRQLLDERMLAYIALTRATERLWISYPRADTDGHPLQPSPYLRDIRSALPELEPGTVADPWTQREPALITGLPELGARLAAEFRYRPALDGEPDPARRAEWNCLYVESCRREEWSATLKRTLAGLAYANRAELAPGIVPRAVADPLVASVSRLERFAACPFSHFAEYTLGLRPRAEAEMAAVDLGTLCHAVLEKFIQRLADQSRSLADMEDDQIAEHIDELAAQIVPQVASEMVLGEGRNAYLLDRSRGHLARVTRWQRNAARAGQFRPRWTEYPFGYDEARRLTLRTPAGRTIHLRGRIDRVDVAELGNELLGLVIDYKRTTDRRLDLTQVLHGLTLQLVGYLLALQQSGHSLAGRPIRPVASLYLPLLEPFQSVRHPSEQKKSSFRLRGVVDRSALEAIDRSVEPGVGSEFLSARLKKDGTPDARCDLAEHAELQELIAFVGWRMGELADRLIGGDISVDPYRLRLKMPCSFCEYRPVCRYEILLQPPRQIDPLMRGDIFKEMARQQSSPRPEARHG